MFFISVVCVAVLVAGFVLRHGNRKLSQILLVAGSILAVAVAVTRFVRTRQSEAVTLRNVEQEAGRRMAEVVASSVAPGSHVLALEMPPLKNSSKDVSHLRMSGARPVLAKAGLKVTVGGPDPFGGGSDEPGFVVFKPENVAQQAVEWCRVQGDIAAVVSFTIEMPSLDRVKAADSPPWYVFFGGPGDFPSKLAEGGPVKAALCYNQDAAFVSLTGQVERADAFARFFSWCAGAP